MAEQMIPCAGHSAFRQRFPNNTDNGGPTSSYPARRPAPVLTEDEQWVVLQLSQVFPHLSRKVLQAAVAADDQSELLAKHILLHRCIDSLLNRQDSPISISDGEDDEDDDVVTNDSTMEDLPTDIIDLTAYCDLEVGNQGNRGNQEDPGNQGNGGNQDDQPLVADDNVQGARPKLKRLPAPVLISDVSSEEEEVVLPVTPEPPREPTVEDQQADTVAQVLEMFPDADADYVRNLVERFWPGPLPLQGCCDYLLEHPDYPKADVQQPAAAASTSKAQDKTKTDFFKEYSARVSAQYRSQVLRALQNEYRRISVKDIRTILCYYNFHYAPVKKFIQENILAKLPDAAVSSPQPRANKRRSDVGPISDCVSVTLEDGKQPKRSFQVRLLKMPRTKDVTRSPLCNELKEEIAFVAERIKQQKEEADHLLALRLNEEQYEAAGQMIECGCCYGEVTFEDMVQCHDGHLFCVDCLSSYTKEKVFGAGQASLSCMTDGCDSTFPMGQLEKALPENILKKYQERLEEENINLAGMDDLVRCPSCDYAAILAEGDKVFRCQNQECMKQTCRHCKEDWAGHFGIPCNEVEKADDTKFRTSIEEKMTEAKIRTCHKCKASFTKQDGCNKMTCRCGAKMCYVCRKPIKDYDHFCRHARDPGSACELCKACSLWTSTEEDDERATEEIQKAAREQKKQEGKDRVADKLGPPPTPNKRPRLAAAAAVPPQAAGGPVQGRPLPQAAAGHPQHVNVPHVHVHMHGNVPRVHVHHQQQNPHFPVPPPPPAQLLEHMQHMQHMQQNLQQVQQAQHRLQQARQRREQLMENMHHQAQNMHHQAQNMHHQVENMHHRIHHHIHQQHHPMPAPPQRGPYL